MKKINNDDIINLWLEKYHNTNATEVAKLHPELSKTPEWFKLYPCTQEQCDAWEKETKELLNKKYRISKHFINKQWSWIYLDCAPYVPEEI